MGHLLSFLLAGGGERPAPSLPSVGVWPINRKLQFGLANHGGGLGAMETRLCIIWCEQTD